jgi:Fic family protein
MALNVALNFLKEGKYQKASRIYKYALRLDPRNIEALTSYAEFLELYKKDIIKAEHFYTKVIYIQPDNDKALLNLKRAAPLVSKLDRAMFSELDTLLRRFYDIPARNAALRRAKREAYFLHIYHSNAIEGNTLNLQQTRHIIENRVAVGGKSIIEHNEVLGLDAAMRYINHTLLYRPFGQFVVSDILEIHRRVLGFCDPIESGKFRKHQVVSGR